MHAATRVHDQVHGKVGWECLDDFCGLQVAVRPSDRTAKSDAFRPVTGSPTRSLTTTVAWMSGKREAIRLAHHDMRRCTFRRSLVGRRQQQPKGQEYGRKPYASPNMWHHVQPMQVLHRSIRPE